MDYRDHLSSGERQEEVERFRRDVSNNEEQIKRHGHSHAMTYSINDIAFLLQIIDELMKSKLAD